MHKLKKPLLLKKERNSKESRLKSIRQEIQASKGERYSAAKDGEFKDFLDTDSDATTSSSWSDTDKDDAENSDMDISDDDFDKGNDDATGFRVFMYDKSKELPKFTPITPTVTCSSMKDYTNLLNDKSENELTDLLSRLVFTDAQTTFAVANLNHEVTSLISSASEVPFGINVDVQATKFVLQELSEDSVDHQVSSPPKLEALSTINVLEAIDEYVQAKVLTKMKKQLPIHLPKVVANFVKPHLNNIVLEVIKNNQINLFTTPSPTTTNDLSKLELKIKLYNRITFECTRHRANLKKRPHDDQDPPNDREGKKRKKRRKDARESSSKSSKKDKAPMDSFSKKFGSVDAAKRKSNWFDILLKSNIDQDEDCILGLSTVTVAKKIKELIKKVELTIADLEGAGLEMLKRQYMNYVKLEYHAEQLKASMAEET
ncbi:hypothetical protein Tco_1418641 [Tanacetum coccineum]